MRINTHPGKFLELDFMTPRGLSAAVLAREINVPVSRIADLIAGRRGMTADTAHRLARYFDTEPEFWMHAQASHDLSQAQAKHGESYLQIRKCVA